MSCGKKLGLALVHSKKEPPICDRCDDLERQLADEKARIDCATRGGWLSDDLECAGEDGPACWKHLLDEAQGKLDAVEDRLRKPNKLLHRYSKDGIHFCLEECGACQVLTLFGGSVGRR